MKIVTVWDPFIRLFHWSVALLFILNFTVIEDGSALHDYVGYAVIALVSARLIWGFVGTRYARFDAFTPSRAQVVDHIGGLLKGEKGIHLSHNPLGALMVFNLLGALILLCFSGVAISQNVGAGSIAALIEGVHEFLANYVMFCVGLHVLGVFLDAGRTKVNLIGAMITGRKSVPGDH
ncbi:MAG: cytochrome b/b6 domain-containing protein [Stappiaceae bacterium]